jgi:hypothetical protein
LEAVSVRTIDQKHQRYFEMHEVERIMNDAERDYIPGFDDGEGWDPIMGNDDEWIDTDDMWLDDFQGEEEFA